MTPTDWLLLFLITVVVIETVWINQLTRKYHRMSDALSRASAAAAAHRLLVAELQQLIKDDEDMNKCLHDEVEGKAFERAREVTYEQATIKKEDVDTGLRLPWVPRENPK